LTVFYIIEDNEQIVKIEKITTIERAHKEYSRRSGWDALAFVHPQDPDRPFFFCFLSRHSHGV